MRATAVLITERRAMERTLAVLKAAAQPPERSQETRPRLFQGRKAPVTTCTCAHGEKWRRAQDLEGPIALLECAHGPECCPRSSTCATRDIWMQMGQLMRSLLESTTLEDLCGQQREKERPAAAMYHIWRMQVGRS